MAQATEQCSPSLYDGDRVNDVLVPLGTLDDGRGPAIAGRYAAAWGVPVRLVHAATESSPANLLDVAADAMTSAHPGLDVEGLSVDAADVAGTILDTASDRSLVVLASDQSSRWLGDGSIGEELVRRSSTPIVLCGPHCQSPPVGSSVVVPLDGSTRAEAALGPARAVADASGARLWLVTAVPQATVETVADMRAEGAHVSESAYLRGMADVLLADGVDVAWQVVHDDDAVAGIASFVRYQGSSMVVAATHGETGMAKHLFGSITFGLVDRLPVPVMVIRPEIADPIALPASGDDL